MKIAYLILCHKDPEHIRRLSQKLLKNNEDEVFIHIDGKTDVSSFERNLEAIPRVHILNTKHKVFWGGYSSIEATIDLMREAFQGGGKSLCASSRTGISN